MSRRGSTASTRHTVIEFVVTLHDDPFAGEQTAFDHRLVVQLGPRLDKTFFDDAVGPHDEDVGTAFLDHDRLGRYDHGILTHVEQQLDLGELAGQQDMVGLGISARTEKVPVSGSTCGSAKSTSPRSG